MPTIRLAGPDDVEALIDLRLRLCRELEGVADEEVLSSLEAATRRYLEAKLPTGELLVWVVEHEGAIVGMSGLLFFERPPTISSLSGVDAYVMNMYTVPEWRGQGLASALLRELIAYVRSTPSRRIWLHASAAGRPVYEAQGFVANPTAMQLRW